MTLTSVQIDALLAEGVARAAIDRAIARLTPVAGGRRIGPRATALIHHFESCRLTAYRCPAGKWTIGWGNTFYANGRPVQQGDTITQATADELFRTVLRQFEDGVAAVTPEATPAQFGAMVSLAWNIGLGPPFGRPLRQGEKPGFRQSEVLRHHRAGRHAEAADAFLNWVRAGGQVSRGLQRRRAAERLLYLNDLAAFDRAIGYRP